MRGRNYQAGVLRCSAVNFHRHVKRKLWFNGEIKMLIALVKPDYRPHPSNYAELKGTQEHERAHKAASVEFVGKF